MTAAARSEVRLELVSRIPAGSEPGTHLAAFTFLVLASVAAALLLLRRVTAWDLAFVPVFLVAGNAVEWHAHRGLFHRQVRYLERLHRAHVEHHRIYVTEDMAMRHPRELRLVLLPWPALLLVLATALPLGAAFAVAGQPNLAALWVASVGAYLLAFEWLHVLYHLPLGKLAWRLPFLAALSQRHAMHHSPQLHRFNLNVTAPLWDFLRGTLWRPVRGRAVTSHASA